MAYYNAPYGTYKSESGYGDQYVRRCEIPATLDLIDWVKEAINSSISDKPDLDHIYNCLEECLSFIEKVDAI